MIVLKVEAEYLDGFVVYVMDAPALPSGVSWHKGLWFMDDPVTGDGACVDEVHVDVKGNVEVMFYKNYASTISEENDAMYKVLGWRLSTES